MKNIIFNKTKSFVGRNTSDHACQIFYSKSKCGNMYHWFFILEITVVKKMNNLNVCSSHSYLYPQSRFKFPLCKSFDIYIQSVTIEKGQVIFRTFPLFPFTRDIAFFRGKTCSTATIDLKDFLFLILLPCSIIKV